MMVRGYYSNPRPGTKKAMLVALLVRPEGVTTAEAEAEIGPLPKGLTNAVGNLEDMNGYDIRTFRCPANREQRKSRRGAKEWVYKIVGRREWNGGYKDFIRPKEYEDA